MIAPTLAPLSMRALARGLAAALAPATSRDHLTSSLKSMFVGSDVAVYGSGRAALAESLRLAMKATGRQRVVLPAFTSFSVAAAAVHAGVTPVLCDMDPSTLALDRDALRRCVDDRTAAVVVGNLFGWPEPVADLGWVSSLGAVLIDDAAQALGSRDSGRLVGSRSPLGILSFGRGKCVSLGDAGALLLNDADLRAHLPSVPWGGRGFGAWAAAVAVTVSRSRLVFAGLARLPGARIGESHFEPTFETVQAPASVRAMAVDLPDVTTRMRETRRTVAAMWREALSSRSGFAAPPESGAMEPAFLRYPVRVATLAQRECVLGALASVGLLHARSFPVPLGEIPEFARHLLPTAPMRGAALLAETVIALPCHAAVSQKDVRRCALAMTHAMEHG